MPSLTVNTPVGVFDITWVNDSDGYFDQRTGFTSSVVSGIQYELTSYTDNALSLSQADIENPIYIIPDHLRPYYNTNFQLTPPRFNFGSSDRYLSGLWHYVPKQQSRTNLENSVSIYYEVEITGEGRDTQYTLNVFGYGIGASREAQIATLKGHAASYWLRKNPDSTRSTIQITQGSPESETGFGFNVQPLLQGEQIEFDIPFPPSFGLVRSDEIQFAVFNDKKELEAPSNLLNVLHKYNQKLRVAQPHNEFARYRIRRFILYRNGSTIRTKWYGYNQARGQFVVDSAIDDDGRLFDIDVSDSTGVFSGVSAFIPEIEAERCV